ncbi:MAG TPA: hypothetical protein VNE16_10050 [Vicinamibacterales bacterium]|nr:hypothetical protein [Vicinamibacterales bacterium]
MSTVKRMATVLSVAALALVLFGSRAQADTWNDLSYVTFSGPVTLPGVALPAGTYMFTKVPDTPLVQVFSKTGNQIYATLFTIPDIHNTPASHTIVALRETPVGQPPAVRVWFYPGHDTGSEFLY